MSVPYSLKMTLSSLFTSRQIEDVIKSTFPISQESALAYTVTKWQQANYLLDVQSEAFKRQFVLVKVTDHTVIHQTSNPALVSALFAVQSNCNEVFYAFDEQQMRNLQPAERNNVHHLTQILKTLAETQSAALLESNANCEHRILREICDWSEFGSFAKADIEEILLRLQEKLDALLKSDLLVRSIWSPDANNAFIQASGGVLLDVSSNKTLPPTYDALMYIFSLSNDLFRQKHFEALLGHYFNVLSSSLKHASGKQLTELYKEEQVRVLLPIVKIEQLRNLDRSIDVELIEEIVRNVSNYLSHPIINQEDVNEVVKNYLDSTDYVLLEYKLVALDETNGHLGEYYHLDIKVTPLDRNVDQDINLFAKFLIPSTEFMKQMVHAGPGKKENFFYTTLYPAFFEYGLQDLLDYAPKCYLSRNSSLIVLDDLSKLGYTSLTPNFLLDYQSVSIVVSKLANFHCSSIILEEILSKREGRRVQLNECYGEFLKDVVLDPAYGIIKSLHARNLISLQHMAAKCPDLTKKLGLPEKELKTVFRNAFDQIFKLKTESEFRNVINHGDMYIGNYLLKFNKTTNTAEDVKLIDFQMLRYIPPASELLFCIISSTTKQVRDQYLQELLDRYYEIVSKNLKAFGFDPQVLFPKEMFEKSLRSAKLPATVLALSYGSLIHIDPDFRVEIMHDNEKSKYYFEDHREELVDMFWDNQHFQSVMRGLLEDLIDAIKESGV